MTPEMLDLLSSAVSKARCLACKRLEREYVERTAHTLRDELDELASLVEESTGNPRLTAD